MWINVAKNILNTQLCLEASEGLLLVSPCDGLSLAVDPEAPLAIAFTINNIKLIWGFFIFFYIFVKYSLSLCCVFSDKLQCK